MEDTNRRDFLKKTALAGASMLAAPLLSSCGSTADRKESSPSGSAHPTPLIVPKAKGLKITGTFLDEISHDIPHQNWGEKEWDRDFAYMKAIGIDTVIVIRSGYRKFLTYPSEDLMKKRGAYAPSLDLIELFLTLSDKYGMKFYFGLYDSGHYWDTGDMSWELEDNKYVIE